MTPEEQFIVVLLCNAILFVLALLVHDLLGLDQ